MRVEILGYWGGFPFNGGATSGYLISTNNGKVLLDCGSGIMRELSLRTNVYNLSAIILSHLHYDHIADIGVVQYAMVKAMRLGKKTEKLPIYAPDSPEFNFKSLQSDQTKVHIIETLEEIEIADIKITFCAVNHTIPSFAVRMECDEKSFVYSADTAYDKSLIEFAKDADLFICEATICDNSVHTVGLGHMSASEAGKIAKKANVRKLVLSHLPHDGDFELMKRQAFATFGGKVDVATEKQIFHL